MLLLPAHTTTLSLPAAEIVSTFDHPELVKLGHCDLIEEVMIGEDSLIRFSGVAAGAACTVVVSLLPLVLFCRLFPAPVLAAGT